MADHEGSFAASDRERVPVKTLFADALLHQPATPDLLPGALARYQRKRSRRRVGYAVGSVLTVAAAVAAGTVAVGGTSSETTVSPSGGSSAGDPCSGPWRVEKPVRPELVPDPKTTIGPRTPDDASWSCHLVVPALVNALTTKTGTVTVQIFHSSYTFTVPGGTATPMPPGGFPPAQLGRFQIRTADGRTAVFTSYAFSAAYPDMSAAERCKMTNVVCRKDGDYIVEDMGSWPEGTGFWVHAPDGGALLMGVSGGRMDRSGNLVPENRLVPDPLTAEQLHQFETDPGLVKIAEAELEHFAIR